MCHPAMGSPLMVHDKVQTPFPPFPSLLAVSSQELPSPSPPPFSPPGLAPGASLVPSPAPEPALGGECWGGWEGAGRAPEARLSCWVLPGCRQDGTSSGQSSPDLAATRLRPVSAFILGCCDPKTCPSPSVMEPPVSFGRV